MKEVLGPGSVAVITGGASGIGFAIAEDAAKLGMRIALADVQGGEVEAAGRRLAAAGAEVMVGELDVADGPAFERFRDAVLGRFGRADLLCNNAGVALQSAPMWEMSLADWRWVVSVNLWGVIHGVRAFLPAMIDQGRGHVANVASMAGLTVIPGNGPYNVAKHGVVSLSETLRAELDLHHPAIGVTVLCPSLVATRIRESERHRPQDLRVNEVSPGADRPPPSGAGVLDAYEVSAILMNAIRENRLYATTHPGAAARVRQRTDRIFAEID